MPDVRLIDANALPMYKVKIVHSFGIVEGSVVFPDDIQKAPTIDAVPVVRCRECNNTKWWPTPKDTIFCDKWGEWMPCNGFCHMGAKMDGGAD